jgi:hypothetical protein
LFSQEKINWGKPTDEEKALKICSFDSTASAVILSEIGSIQFKSGCAYIYVYRKIKILNSNGVHFANIQIPYYFKDKLEDITDVRAQTINIENGKIIKSEIKGENIFRKVQNSRWSDIRFAFPAVREGSILEYKYIFATKRITFLDSWIFQHEIPALHSEIQVEIPLGLKYSIVFFGKKLMTKYYGRENNDNFWSLNNIPGYENESNVFCYEDYAEKLQFQLLSYDEWERSGYGGINTISVMKNWDSLAEEMSGKFNIFLGRGGKAKGILDTLINSADTKDVKIQKIYRFVRTNIIWDNDYYIYNEKSPNELLESRSGNSAEINLMLCLLLREAGIDADPVLISTKSHGKITKNYPLLEQFNHLIVAIDNGSKFIDAASSSGNYNIVPYQHINYSGYLIDNKNNHWVDIGFQTDSKDNKDIVCRIDSSAIHMQVKHKYSGYYASEVRNTERNNDYNPPQVANFISDRTFKADSAKKGDVDNEYSDYSDESYYSSKFNFGDRIIINLNFSNIDNPFKQKVRLFPVELDYPFSKQSTYSIQFPEGYKLKIVPRNLTIALPDKAGRFVYNISSVGNQILIMVRQEIRSSFMPAENYYDLKEFYNQIIMKLNEPIVIEKES